MTKIALPNHTRMMLTVADITRAIEEFAPLQLQESYDNAGLITGSHSQTVTKALLTLDCTEDVVDEAIKKGCELIVAHHPIVFSGLKKITGSGYVERTIIKAIKKDIAIYACHTNIDNVREGVNQIICEKIGLSQPVVLRPMRGQLFKLHTYIPTEHANKLRDTLFNYGAGNIGKYSECSFNILGRGTFRGNYDSDPVIGEKGIRETVDETKIEVIFPGWKKADVLRALKQGHIYEEVAYEIYPLENIYQETGAGLVGELEKPLAEKDFLQHLKDSMNLVNIRHTPFTKKNIKTVAVCGGAGIAFLKDAIAKKADAYVTADVKYHRFFDADGRILLCDIGHFESERFTIELFHRILKRNFPTFASLFSKVNTNPVNHFQ